MRRLVSFLAIVLSGWAGQLWAEAQHFQSPSGNIQCLITDEAGNFVRCDLGVDRQTYTERPAACEGDWGTSFGVTETGTGFLNCVTGAIDPPDRPVVLPYGVILKLQAITCQSEPTGITCTNDDGGGFSVRRAEQRIF